MKDKIYVANKKSKRPKVDTTVDEEKAPESEIIPV